MYFLDKQHIVVLRMKLILKLPRLTLDTTAGSTICRSGEVTAGATTEFISPPCWMRLSLDPP